MFLIIVNTFMEIMLTFSIVQIAYRISCMCFLFPPINSRPNALASKCSFDFVCLAYINLVCEFYP